MQDHDSHPDEFAESLRAAADGVNQPPTKSSLARIAELRRLYLSGQYRPDAEDVAAKLIDDHTA